MWTGIQITQWECPWGRGGVRRTAAELLNSGTKLCGGLESGDQVSHPYIITPKITLLYMPTVICRFLGKRWQGQGMTHCLRNGKAKLTPLLHEGVQRERGRRGMVPHIINLGARRRWVNKRPRTLYPPGRNPGSSFQEAGWAPEPVGTF